MLYRTPDPDLPFPTKETAVSSGIQSNVCPDNADAMGFVPAMQTCSKCCRSHGLDKLSDLMLCFGKLSTGHFQKTEMYTTG